MVKVIILFLFVTALAFAPVWAFDSMVMPQLFSLKDAYGNAEANVQQVLDASQK